MRQRKGEQEGVEMNYREVMEYIEQAGQYGISPGLDSIRELCRRLGDPQGELKFVHVAGTNGKGSVSAYLSSVLKCGGYRVGRFLSPAVFEYREIIQVNDRPVPKTALCEGMEKVRQACDEMVKKGRPHPTLFEMETALGFWYFREKKCDIVVLETGMGGLLDATNVIEKPSVAVVASVSMDHMKYLGDTLPQIAVQKAGIIKRDCAVVSAAQDSGVMAVISGTAGELGCPLTVVEKDRLTNVRSGPERQKFDYKEWKNMEISLGGVYQTENAALALEALKVLGGMGFPVTEAVLRRGMKETGWPGRFTVVGRRPYFIVDGAHNEDGARRLAESLERYFPHRRIIFIMGMLKDKEYGKVIALTHSLADQIITVTPPGNPRALSAYELACEAAVAHRNVTAADSLEEAVEMSRLLAGKDDVIVAFGSLSYLGKLMETAGFGEKGKGRK